MVPASIKGRVDAVQRAGDDAVKLESLYIRLMFRHRCWKDLKSLFANTVSHSSAKVGLKNTFFVIAEITSSEHWNECDDNLGIPN